MEKRHRYIILKGNANYTQVEIDKIGEKAATLEEFKDNVPKDAGRWIIYDAEWKEDDGSQVRKILLMAYSPDANPDISSKFVIPNSFGAIKAELPEFDKDKTINNWNDLTLENFRSWFQ